MLKVTLTRGIPNKPSQGTIFIFQMGKTNGKELTILSRGLGRQLLQIVFQNSLLQQ
jgi:hypothetical protein